MTDYIQKSPTPLPDSETVFSRDAVMPVGHDDPIDQLADQTVRAWDAPTPAGANTRQVGGSHYGLTQLQHWDVVAIFDLGYFEGQITKYLFRWRKKNGIEDLRKAQHYLEKLIELEESRSSAIRPSEDRT